MIEPAIYTGSVRHRRFAPVPHAFRYRLCLLFLDLDRLDETLGDSRWHSMRRAAMLRYRREDFLGDPAVPLAEAVRDCVARRTGRRPRGPVMLLANLRWFGLLMNPIACYYCYEDDGETLAAVVAEVTNSPWGERHAYVLPADGKRTQEDGSRPEGRTAEARDRVLRMQFDKAMHVSPFNPMDMRYLWRSSTPGERLAIHLENHRDGRCVFDATLGLRREALTPGALRRCQAHGDRRCPRPRCARRAGRPGAAGCDHASGGHRSRAGYGSA